LATPQVVPPTVPATWVPWPLQSLPFWPSPIEVEAEDWRGRRTRCGVKRMPLSMM
jgi:hypothetical protein